MQDIVIELDVPVPMRDGTVLRADVYRPAGDGRYPVLLARTPYGKSVHTDYLVDIKSMVPAGYVVICQDVRGRIMSDGEWMPWKHERQDGYDSVEWAASLPYSNGKVGMFGASYHGSTQWSAAISGAPSLRTISPTTTWSDPADGLMFRGGVVELGLNAAWGLLTALGQHPKEGLAPNQVIAKLSATISSIDSLASAGYWGLPSGSLPAVSSTGQPDLGVARALADPGTTDDSRVSNRYDQVDIPTLNFAGWYDVFLQGALDNYVGMRSRGRVSKLVVGPWEHLTMMSAFTGAKVGAVNFGVMSQLPGGRSYSDIHRAWYDHWLKELPATDDHESGVLIFVMGINEWRAEAEWPLARAVDTPLFLGKDSRLTWSPPTEAGGESAFVYDPNDPVTTNGGNVLLAVEYPAGPFDQREQELRDDVLVYTTAAFQDDVEVTGRIRAVLFAATDGPSTDWVVRLCEVDAQGVSRNLADGVTRVQTKAGRVDEIEIDLWSTSIVIRSGHRLRVQVTSSNFPRWDRNLNTGEPVTEGTTVRVAHQRILHDRAHPSRVVLPIVPD